jgi:hypothetical protein
MERFCYATRLLPGKGKLVRDFFRGVTAETKHRFWEAIGIERFTGWLQGDYLIRCIEGADVVAAHERMRHLISEGNEFALQLQQLYRDAAGIDYADPSIVPELECTMDFELPGDVVFERAFFLPLRPEKEQAHLEFCDRIAAEGTMKPIMEAFGTVRLTEWLQKSGGEMMLVTYAAYGRAPEGTSEERIEALDKIPGWKEVSDEIKDHTGLDQLSPDVESIGGN